MIDSVVCHISMQKQYTRQLGQKHMIIGDVADYALTSSTRHIVRDPITHEITHGDLYHPFESLPSHFSGVAMKFYDTAQNCLPYVSLNASIAKIGQGHNVFGHENLYAGVVDMLFVLKQTYPVLWSCLDIDNARLSRIDVTYSAKLPSLTHAEQTRDFLRNVDWGRLRNNSKKERWNTVYFGAEDSRVGVAVVYCKGVELSGERKKLERQAKKGDLSAISKLSIFTPELQDYADRLLRFEARCKARQIEQFGISTNLWDFIAHIFKNKQTLFELWNYKFKPIFDALKGKHMSHADDSELLNLLKDKLKTYTYPMRKNIIKSMVQADNLDHALLRKKPIYFVTDVSRLQFFFIGKLSYVQALNAFNFYKRLKQDGFMKVKELHSKATFCRNVKNLVDCGISRSHLQNLHSNDGHIVPIIQLINIDFANQLPADYKPFISPNLKEFNHYLVQRGLEVKPQLYVA